MFFDLQLPGGKEMALPLTLKSDTGDCGTMQQVLHFEIPYLSGPPFLMPYDIFLDNDNLDLILGAVFFVKVKLTSLHLKLLVCFKSGIVSLTDCTT